MLDLIPPPKAVNSDSEETPVKTSPVRLLTEAEIQTLAPVFAERSAQIPDPSTSFFVGTADSDGTVTSFLVVQLRVHAEPMWIKPGHEAVFRGLVRGAERTIQERTGGGCDVFLFSPAGKVARMAEVSGMRMEPWTVYSKYIEATGPSEDRQLKLDLWDKPATEEIQ